MAFKAEGGGWSNSYCCNLLGLLSDKHFANPAPYVVSSNPRHDPMKEILSFTDEEMEPQSTK